MILSVAEVVRLPTRHMFGSLTTSATVMLMLCASVAQARTIVLTDEDCEEMAAISALAPRVSWAGVSYGAGEFIDSQIDVTTKTTFLIKYPLDKIPKNQRITKAELTVPYALLSPAAGIRTEVRRVLVDWGPGVCHQYRRIRPERLEWKSPGAGAVGQDRAVKATAAGILKGSGEHTFNVTEDVELWHSGATGNHGWMITTDDPMGYLRLNSPFWSGAKLWKLRITFEPK